MSQLYHKYIIKTIKTKNLNYLLFEISEIELQIKSNITFFSISNRIIIVSQ